MNEEERLDFVSGGSVRNQVKKRLFLTLGCSRKDVNNTKPQKSLITPKKLREHI